MSAQTTGPTSGTWSDLKTRLISAVVMVVIGIICIWQGDIWFRGLVSLVAMLGMWELLRMRAPEQGLLAWGVAALTGIVVFVLPSQALVLQIVLLAVPVVAAAALAAPQWKMAAAYAFVLVAGSTTLVAVRDDLGFGWLVWIVAIVVAADVAGYFAGKALGGPKFWPAISPKKTWSGTVAGWIGAALVGVLFGLGSGVTGAVVALSVALSFAGQLGDIAESAIKRRSGVKDSSALIPGHGGVLDRFDGLLGASVMLSVIAALTGFPEGLF